MQGLTTELAWLVLLKFLSSSLGRGIWILLDCKGFSSSMCDLASSVVLFLVKDVSTDDTGYVLRRMFRFLYFYYVFHAWTL
jgi:hypothetical protein